MKTAKDARAAEIAGAKRGLGKRILVWDLETTGVNAFCADQGFVVCFGYKWVGDKKAKCISLLDYPGKNCHDDSKLLAASLEIMEQADLLVGHYADRFDRKFFASRLIRAGLKPIPQTRQADTCLIARAKLKLTSNRLDNLARFLKCKTRKMPKGDGWPDWWFGALRGDRESIRKMSLYCAQDCDCAEEVFLKMRHIIPNKYLLNHAINSDRVVCVACGGHVQHRGSYFSEKKLFHRFQCTRCGKWGHDPKPFASAP